MPPTLYLLCVLCVRRLEELTIPGVIQELDDYVTALPSSPGRGSVTAPTGRPELSLRTVSPTESAAFQTCFLDLELQTSSLLM